MRNRAFPKLILLKCLRFCGYPAIVEGKVKEMNATVVNKLAIRFHSSKTFLEQKPSRSPTHIYTNMTHHRNPWPGFLPQTLCILDQNKSHVDVGSNGGKKVSCQKKKKEENLVRQNKFKKCFFKFS